MGKLGHLTAAVLWAARCKERTVISTHTIALQHQLIEKDLPLLLKSTRPRYRSCRREGDEQLCLLETSRRKEEQQSFFAEDEKATQQLRTWADNSSDGSRASLPFSLPGGTWDSVAAERDACTHIQCPHYKKCFFFKARKKAEDAQVLIVNHHLLLLDCLDKKKNAEEERSILPEYTRLVIDEAHHLEDIALDILAVRSSKRELFTLFARLVSEREGHLGSLQRVRRLLAQYNAVDPALLQRL